MGTDGPYTSASSNPILRLHLLANATAKFTIYMNNHKVVFIFEIQFSDTKFFFKEDSLMLPAVDDFPTPPLPDATAMISLTPVNRSSVVLPPALAELCQKHEKR